MATLKISDLSVGDWVEILRIMSAYLVALVGVSVGFSLNAERIVRWLLNGV